MTGNADQIDHLLQYISADDYQNWIKVGMGLKNEFGDSGLQLWDKGRNLERQFLVPI